MPTWVYTVVCKCLQWSVCELKCTLVNSTVNLCKMKNHVLVISSNSHLHISVLLKGSNAYKRKRNLRNVSLSSLEMKTFTEYLPSQYCFTLTTLAVNGREVSQKTSAASLHVPGSLGNQILRLCVLPWRAVSLQPPLGAVNAQVSLKDACWCSHCRPLKARPPPTQHIHAESDGRSQCAQRHRRFQKAGLTHRSRRIQTDTPLWPRGLRGPMLQTQHSYTDRSPWAPRSHGPVQEPVSEWALGVCKQVKFN